MTDDLRSPLDDLQRLRDAEVKTREIIQKYQAAMREMMVRFEILDQDLNLKKHRNPIHHLESRIKKPASIFEKLERYGKEPTLENLERYIMDVAGVRVICSYIHDVYNLLELLQKQDDLEIVEIKDYINNPKLNGYRSLHVIVRIPVYFLDKKELIPVEVQLRTIAMDFWASLDHQLKYKKSFIDDNGEISEELKQCAEVIAGTDVKMLEIRKKIEARASRCAGTDRDCYQIVQTGSSRDSKTGFPLCETLFFYRDAGQAHWSRIPGGRSAGYPHAPDSG